ncbi:SH3 domain-containing protein 3 [Linum grandiflorum]
MNALRKQASKLRGQVSKQQQAMKKQFSGSGYEGSDSVVIDEVELQRHQQLEKLYRTTRAGRVTVWKTAIAFGHFAHLENNNCLENQEE